MASVSWVILILVWVIYVHVRIYGMLEFELMFAAYVDNVVLGEEMCCRYGLGALN